MPCPGKEDRKTKKKSCDHLQQTGTNKLAQYLTIPQGNNQQDNNNQPKQTQTKNYAGGAEDYLQRDTSHSAQRNKHNAASAKRQVILPRCAALKYPHSHKEETQSQLRVRQIQANLSEEGPNDQIEEESVDPDSALYTQELTEDWADVNHIIPSTFNPMKNWSLNKTHAEEIWVETRTTNNQTVHWLADTGSPRSFLTLEKAKEILKDNPKIALQPYKSKTEYRCFNNNNIKVEGTLHLTLQSGSWTARDIFQKLGIALQQRPKQSPVTTLTLFHILKPKKYHHVGT